MDVLSTVLVGKESKRLIWIRKLHVKGCGIVLDSVKQGAFIYRADFTLKQLKCFYISKKKMLLKIEYGGLMWIK